MSTAPVFASGLPRVRLTGPADLVVCLPYLLGFPPRESLVAVALNEVNEMVMLARVDLPEMGEPSTPEHVAQEFGRRIGWAATRAGAVAAVVVAYPETDLGAEGRGGWKDRAGHLRDAFGAHGVDLLDALLVVGGHWWSLLCSDDLCCPVDGTPLPPPGSTLAETLAIEAGLFVRADRRSVGLGLLPADEPARARFQDLIGACSATAEAPERGLQVVEASLAALLAGEGLPSDQELAAVAVAANQTLVRDSLSHYATAAQSHAAIELWSAVLRLAPDPMVADPACLLALAAYQNGNGLLARLALDRALEAEPGHVLAGDLARSLDSGIPPDRVENMCREASEVSRARLRETG